MTDLEQVMRRTKLMTDFVEKWYSWANENIKNDFTMALGRFMDWYYFGTKVSPKVLPFLKDNFLSCPQCGANLPTFQCPNCQLRFKTPKVNKEGENDK